MSVAFANGASKSPSSVAAAETKLSSQRPAAAGIVSHGPGPTSARPGAATHAFTASALVAAGASASRRRRRQQDQCRVVSVTSAGLTETPAHSDVEEAPLLNDAWEQALRGCEGDVWSEPQVFAKIVGPLNAPEVGESVGSVRFERVSAREGDGDIVLYVPGIDFAGVMAARQFRGLAKEGHEVWRCFVGSDDRTPFALMVRHVEAWIRDRLAAGRRVVLIGESFGGLLCLALGQRIGESLGASALKGLVLVNPATSFERTFWPLLGKAATALPTGGPLPAPTARTDTEFLQEMQGRFAQKPYAYLGSFALAGSVADLSQLGRAASRVTTTMMDARERDDGPQDTPNETLVGFLTYPEQIAMLLPPDTVRFRLRAWLRDGCEAVNSELRLSGRVGTKTTLPPTLLVSSYGDRVLNSGTEGQRLQPLLKWRCGGKRFKYVELGDEVGHAPLDGRLDLAELLRTSPIYEAPTPIRDYVNSYELPNIEVFEQGSKNIEPIASLLSPVFCSWDSASGSRRFGLDGVPDPAVEKRPVLLIGNHQLLALDLGPLVREFLAEKGFSPRGLAHPLSFPDVLSEMFADGAQPTADSPGLLDALGLPFELRSAARASLEAANALSDESNGKSATNSDVPNPMGARPDGDIGVAENFGLGGTFTKWGAVPVTPRNFIGLLSRGEAILLFPGGAKEACHGPMDKYRVMWPEKTDFVRAAAKYNAIVVPFGSVGCADNVSYIPQDLGPLEPFRSALPLPMRGLEPPQNSGNSINEKIKGGGLMPVSETLESGLGFPALMPKLALSQQDAAGFGDRMYLSFGEPVDLRDINHKDREACEQVYGQVQKAVEGEIAWLLEKRTQDPYRDFLRRQAYERIANLDPVPRKIRAGPLKGEDLRSCGRRAPSFEL